MEIIFSIGLIALYLTIFALIDIRKSRKKEEKMSNGIIFKEVDHKEPWPNLMKEIEALTQKVMCIVSIGRAGGFPVLSPKKSLIDKMINCLKRKG